MKRIKLALLGLGLIALLAIAGCSGGTQNAAGATPPSQQAGPVKELNIDAFNWGFTESDVTINKGDLVRLRFTSSSGTHGIAIPSAGISVGPVSPGQERIVEFVAQESGPLDYFCNVPCGQGHSGMRGQLIIN